MKKTILLFACMMASVAYAQSEEWIIKANDDGQYGFINTNDTTKKIDYNYDLAFPFSEGLAPVEKNMKWGFIDEKEKTMIPFIYDWAFSFSDGLAAVEKYGKWGFIDTTEAIIIPFIYDFAYSFLGDYAYVNKDGEWFFINKQGERTKEEDCDKTK